MWTVNRLKTRFRTFQLAFLNEMPIIVCSFCFNYIVNALCLRSLCSFVLIFGVFKWFHTLFFFLATFDIRLSVQRHSQPFSTSVFLEVSRSLWHVCPYVSFYLYLFITNYGMTQWMQTLFGLVLFCFSFIWRKYLREGVIFQ